jgi:hypothetical protein
MEWVWAKPTSARTAVDTFSLAASRFQNRKRAAFFSPLSAPLLKIPNPAARLTAAPPTLNQFVENADHGKGANTAV